MSAFLASWSSDLFNIKIKFLEINLILAGPNKYLPGCVACNIKLFTDRMQQPVVEVIIR